MRILDRPWTVDTAADEPTPPESHRQHVRRQVGQQADSYRIQKRGGARDGDLRDRCPTAAPRETIPKSLTQP